MLLLTIAPTALPDGPNNPNPGENCGLAIPQASAVPSLSRVLPRSYLRLTRPELMVCYSNKYWGMFPPCLRKSPGIPFC